VSEPVYQEKEKGRRSQQEEKQYEDLCPTQEYVFQTFWKSGQRGKKGLQLLRFIKNSKKKKGQGGRSRAILRNRNGEKRFSKLIKKRLRTPTKTPLYTTVYKS